MDETRFDSLARTLASAATRRRTLAGLLVGALPTAVILEEEVDARKRRKRRQGKADSRAAGRHDQRDAVDSEKKKKRKKKKKPATPPPTTQSPALCTGGTTPCGGSCVDTASDARNCGACGRACAAGEACVAGACGLTCGAAGFCGVDAANPDCCAGTCTTTESDRLHCGACGAACDGQTTNQCVTGTCQCGSGAPCAAGATCCSGGGSGDGACRTLETDLDHCGACGNACPGANQPATSNASCTGGTCTFSCKGQNYDVDGNAETGCERADTQTNRTQATATYLGSKPCDDGPSAGSFSGSLYSDAREHANPAAPGFNAATGSAPLWYRVFADGGTFCQNDAAVNLTMTGGTTDCYKLSLITNAGTTERMITNGQANITLSSGSYSDDTNVYFKVEKTCGTSVREVAQFTASYHL